MQFIKGVYETKVYERPNRIGFANIEVLECLYGKPWNEYALALVHSLRPSYIRVSTGMVQCDARSWRVTVFVDDKNIIKTIHQEVEVGLPEDCQFSPDLINKLGIKD